MPEPKHIQSIEDLRPDDANANLGTERGLRVLDDSLRECGAGRSILADRDGTVLAGNKTLLRAADIGLPVRVVQTDGSELVVVQRTDLALAGDDGQREQARRLAYLDNFSSEQGLKWDATQILADLEAGVNLDGLWRDDELTELLAGLVEPEAVADPGAQLSKADELQERWQVETGDMWTCGQHRICCGDCTDAAVVEKVMEGEKAGAVVTDPPYGIEREGILNDDPKGLRTLYDGCLAVMPIDNAVVIAFQSPRLFPVWLDAVRAAGYKFERMLWMYKPNDETFPWRGWLQTSEAILASSVGKGAWVEVNPYAHDCYSPTTLGQELPKEWGKVHASVKPLVVVQDLVSRIGGTVYDSFLGSGTTLVACQRLGRRGRGIEIHAPYCSVALERLSQMQLDCRKVAGA